MRKGTHAWSYEGTLGSYAWLSPNYRWKHSLAIVTCLRFWSKCGSEWRLSSIVQLFYSGSQVLFFISHDFLDSMANYELTAWNRNSNVTSFFTAPKPMKAQTWSRFFGMNREQNGAREEALRWIKSVMCGHSSTVGCWSSMGKEMDLIPPY